MTTGNNVVDFSVETPRLSIEERTFKNRLGYDIELLDEAGEFNLVVKVPDDTSEVKYLYFREFKSLSVELKEHLKSYFIYLLPRYLPATLRQYSEAVSAFVSALNKGQAPDMAIELALTENPIRNIGVMKSLVRFLILNEYEGLSFNKVEEVLRLNGYSSHKNNYLSLFTLDEELGPFTREELRVLNKALKNEGIPVADRLILALCIQFGLRPIQMSLLKEEDFVEDTELGICYLNIPRVKQNTQYRRCEFTKRVIDDKLATLIRQVLEENRYVYKALDLDSPPLFYRKVQERYLGVFSRSIYGAFRQGLRVDQGHYRITHDEFFNDFYKKDNAHHLSPQVFNKRLGALVEWLPLSPRTEKPFHLTSYRFRYTVGTNAVMEGMSEEEVAYLLDHSSPLCVKHYFRYTREMWELLENATAKRTEQQHFTAAWNREKDLSDNIYGKEVIELHTFTAIGKCQKKAACYLEPAIACYACDKFCPNNDKSSHNNALLSLKDRKDLVKENASSSLSKQLDEAIAGCEAAIAYADGAEVVNIHQGFSNE